MENSSYSFLVDAFVLLIMVMQFLSLNILYFFKQACLRDLRERVARGGDPTKLDEPTVQHDISNPEQGT